MKFKLEIIRNEDKYRRSNEYPYFLSLKGPNGFLFDFGKRDNREKQNLTKGLRELEEEYRYFRKRIDTNFRGEIIYTNLSIGEKALAIHKKLKIILAAHKYLSNYIKRNKTK